VAESVLRFKVETLDANAKIAHLTKKVQGLEVAVKNAGGTTRAAGTGFKAFGSGAQAAAVGARGLGAALSAALGPITAVVAGAASLGQVFNVLRQQDFAEAKVRSLGVNSEELRGRLQGVSRELSGQASVLDLTAAAYDVASAGFNNAADASKILKAASQGATGGFSDINTVADATTSVLNAYGLEADKAAKLVDGFIQTQNDGKIVIGEYAANIAKVAPVAAALGVPLEEVNAAVAQITAGGQGAEVTFTALKTAFAQVAAGKVGKEFEALGIQIDASTLRSEGLAATLEKIKKSGADAGTVIKAFGTEAGPSILALLNDTEKFNRLLENQRNAQEAAAKAAFTASDTIDGQLKRLTTAFQNLFSDQSELGVLIKETFKVAAVTVEALAASVNFTIAPIRALFSLVGEVGSAIASALGIDGVNAAFELEKGFQSVLGRIEQVGTFIIGLGTRIGQFVGGIIANVVEAGKTAATQIANIFGGTFGRIREFLADAYNGLPGPLKALIEGTINVVSGGVKAIAGAATSFVGDTIDAGRGFTPGSGTGTGTQPSAAANAIQATNGALSGGTKPTKDEEAERLARIEKSNQDQIRALEQKTLLASALNAEEKQQFQRQIEIAEILRNEAGLNEQQLQAKLEATTNLYEQQDATKAIIDANKERLEQEKAIKESGKEIADLYKGIGNSIKSGVTDAIMGAIDGTKSLGEAASGILKNIGNQLISFGINSIFGGLGGGGGILGSLFGGGRANGGTVQGGRSYVVGEKGPELFTPGRTGSVAPNSSMGGNISVNVNVDASGSAVQGDGNEGAQLGKAIGAAVQQELMKQKRPGGLLAGV
jgi:TP901 family phage tail tape measure protein|tara:strand:- start:8639 stop:11134 length:2496 start_codon:yes stop_codon:yes gene_type:complete